MCLLKLVAFLQPNNFSAFILFTSLPPSELNAAGFSISQDHHILLHSTSWSQLPLSRGIIFVIGRHSFMQIVLKQITLRKVCFGCLRSQYFRFPVFTNRVTIYYFAFTNFRVRNELLFLDLTISLTLSSSVPFCLIFEI